MRRSSGRAPICCFRSVRQPGRTFSSARCLPNSCSGRHRSLRTIPIIAQVDAMRRTLALLLICPLLAGSALAQSGAEPLDFALQQAEREQASAEAQTARLEQVASRARGEAERLHAEQAAAAQAIQAG